MFEHYMENIELFYMDFDNDLLFIQSYYSEDNASFDNICV